MNLSVDCKNKEDFEKAVEIAKAIGIELKWEKKSLNLKQVNNDKGLHPQANVEADATPDANAEANADVISQVNFEAPVYLSFNGDGFFLESEDGLNLKLSFIDDIRYRRKFQGPKKELIGKACGWHLGFRNILDLTAGLAMDSIFLTQLGFKVTSLERHPALYLLLKTTLESTLKSSNKAIWQNLNFICTNAKDYLEKQLSAKSAPEVIYYDPMYPSSTKSALPGKEMQIFRRILGENEADISLIELAIKKSTEIVVIKRPIKAPPLQIGAGIGKITIPNRCYQGKTVRFDVYKVNHLES